MIRRVVNAYKEAKSLTRSLISALTGLFFYGGWAYFVHYDYGFIVAIKAFCTQGLISFTITLVLTHFMEVLFQRFNSSRVGYWLTASIASILVVVVSYTTNVIVGTPEVIMTILPGSLISAVYSFSYARLLTHLSTE